MNWVLQSPLPESVVLRIEHWASVNSSGDLEVLYYPGPTWVSMPSLCFLHNFGDTNQLFAVRVLSPHAHVLGHMFCCFVVGLFHPCSLDFATLPVLTGEFRDSHKVYCHCFHLPRILISLISYVTDLENKVTFLLYRLYLISISMRQLRNNKSLEDNKNLNKTCSAPVPERTVS